MGTDLEPQKTVRHEIRTHKTQKNDGRRTAMAVLLPLYKPHTIPATLQQTIPPQKEMTLNSVSSHNR